MKRKAAFASSLFRGQYLSQVLFFAKEVSKKNISNKLTLLFLYIPFLRRTLKEVYI